MQHSLHDDRPRFSAASDEDQRSEFPSHTMTASWAAATTTCSGSVDNCMHTGSASTTQGPGSIFRPLFSDVAVVEAAGHGYVEELLQLQLPPAASAVETSFDVLSSSDVYETYTSSHCSDGDFAAAPTFSVEGFLSTSGGSTSGSPAKQNVPHTLEFVSPPAPRGSFHGMSSKKSRLPDAVAAPVPVLASPVENIHYAKGSDGLHSKDNSVNGDEDQQHSMSQIAASSCKKARLQTFEQCNRAANDPSQFQAIMNKVQSARSKEKLGERINALQQLVSPFGKTDTASVLSEAIGYIKFLQEQVQVLSSPYMKPSSTLNRQDGGKEIISDLRSRGLCLVPVSCTINVANNNNFNIGADYWASTPSVGSNTPSTRLSASS